MRRFRVLVRAMLLIQVRNRMTLFWNLVFPLFLLLLYSQIFGQNNVGDTGFMTWVVPGILVSNLLSFGLLSSGASMVNMRETGVLRRLQASPVPAMQLVGSYLLVNVTIALVQSAVLVAFSALAFGISLTWTGVLRALPMVLAGIACFVALGQIIAGLAATAGAAIAAGQIVNFALMFVCDLFMPLATMPAWLQDVAHYLPAYAVVQLVRPPLVEGAFGAQLWPNLGLVLGYALVAALLAARLFRWSPRR